MIEHFANKLATSIYDSLDEKTIADNELEKIHNFSHKELVNRFKVIIIYSILFPLFLVVGLYFGIMIEMIIAIISTIILRGWNGGLHFEIPEVCLLITFSFVTVIPILSHFYTGSNLSLLIISAILILYLSYKDKVLNLKKLSLILIALITYPFTNLFLIAVIIQFIDFYLSKRGDAK